MTEILALLGDEHRVALVGDGTILKELATAALDLKNGRRTSHPELTVFSSWGEVQDCAEYDPSGRDLQTPVEVVDEHGVEVILDTVDQLCPERDAEVTVSTIHQSKGRELATVRTPTTSPNRKTPTTSTSTAIRSRSTPARPVRPTSPSPAPATISTSAGRTRSP